LKHSNVNMNTRTLLLWSLVTSLGAHAQALGVFLDSATQHNVDNRLAREATVRAGADLGSSWGSLLPSLTANGGWTHNQYDAVITLPDTATTTKKVTITPIDQLDATVKVEVPIIDASKWLRTAASSASADAAGAREVASVDQVRRQVVAAFYSFVSSKAVLESSLKSLGVAQAQLAVTDSRTKAGVANELELARAQAEVERNNQVIADAESLVATSARTLRSLSGLEPADVPSLPDDDLHAEAAEAELEQKSDALPQVAAADRDATAAGRTLTAASLALVPTVNAQFTERFTNATGFQNANTLYNAGVTFAWRLDVPAVHALRAQQSAQATAELNAEKTRMQVRDQLHSDWQRVRASITKVKAATSQVAAARRASGLAQERYAAGVATQVDVIQAERDLFSAEVSQIQARGELANARAALRLSAGLPVTDK
jgi:outer membrane protein